VSGKHNSKDIINISGIKKNVRSLFINLFMLKVSLLQFNFHLEKTCF